MSKSINVPKPAESTLREVMNLRSLLSRPVAEFDFDDRLLDALEMMFRARVHLLCHRPMTVSDLQACAILSILSKSIVSERVKTPR